MKKSVLLLAILFTTAISNINAQIDLGVRLGANYDFTGDPTAVGGSTIDAATESAAGFHAGAFVKLQIPIIGIFVQPELLYTEMSGGFTLKEKVAEKLQEFKLENNVSRIDVPILVGKEFLSLIKLYAGPVVSYNLSNSSNIPTELNDALGIDVQKLSNMSLAGMLGVGVDLFGIYADLRYDFGLGDQATEFVKKKANVDGKLGIAEPFFKIPNRSSQLILSVGYAF